MPDWLQRCFRYAKRQHRIGVVVDDRIDVGPGFEYCPMNETLGVGLAAIAIDGHALGVVSDDVVTTDQFRAARPRELVVLGTVWMTDRDVTVGIDHTLTSEDAVGDRQVMDLGVDCAHVPPLFVL